MSTKPVSIRQPKTMYPCCSYQGKFYAPYQAKFLHLQKVITAFQSLCTTIDFKRLSIRVGFIYDEFLATCGYINPETGESTYLMGTREFKKINASWQRIFLFLKKSDPSYLSKHRTAQKIANAITVAGLLMVLAGAILFTIARQYNTSFSLSPQTIGMIGSGIGVAGALANGILHTPFKIAFEETWKPINDALKEKTDTIKEVDPSTHLRQSYKPRIHIDNYFIYDGHVYDRTQCHLQRNCLTFLRKLEEIRDDVHKCMSPSYNPNAITREQFESHKKSLAEIIQFFNKQGFPHKDILRSMITLIDKLLKDSNSVIANNHICNFTAFNLSMSPLKNHLPMTQEEAFRVTKESALNQYMLAVVNEYGIGADIDVEPTIHPLKEFPT